MEYPPRIIGPTNSMIRYGKVRSGSDFRLLWSPTEEFSPWDMMEIRERQGNRLLLDSKTGKTIWTDSYPAPMIDYLHEGGPVPPQRSMGQWSIPSVNTDICMLMKQKTELNSGKRICSHFPVCENHQNGVFPLSPYVLGNMLLIEAGATFALNKQTGELLWKSENYRPAYGSPISLKIGKSMHVAVLKTDGLVIMDAANGKTLVFEKWETSYRTNASTPIIRGNKIFISTGYRRGCALFQWNGKTLQKNL